MPGRNPRETLAKCHLVDERAGLVEWRFRRAVLHELDAHEATFCTDVADDGVPSLHGLQAAERNVAEMGGVLQQIFLLDDLSGNERCGAGHGVAAIAARRGDALEALLERF